MIWSTIVRLLESTQENHKKKNNRDNLCLGRDFNKRSEVSLLEPALLDIYVMSEVHKHY